MHTHQAFQINSSQSNNSRKSQKKQKQKKMNLESPEEAVPMPEAAYMMDATDSGNLTWA